MKTRAVLIENAKGSVKNAKDCVIRIVNAVLFRIPSVNVTFVSASGIARLQALPHMCGMTVHEPRKPNRHFQDGFGNKHK